MPAANFLYSKGDSVMNSYHSHTFHSLSLSLSIYIYMYHSSTFILSDVLRGAVCYLLGKTLSREQTLFLWELLPCTVGVIDVSQVRN